MPNLPDTVSNTLVRDENMVRSGANSISPGTTTDQSEEYRKQIGLLCKVGKRVNTNVELKRLLHRILRMSQKALQVSASSLLLIDKTKNDLYFEVAEGEARKVLKPVRLSIDSGIVGWVARNAKPVVSNNVASDPRFNKEIDKITSFVTKSVLAVPMTSGDEVIGVIEVLNKKDGTRFNKQDLEVLMAVAAMSAVAISNSRLHQDVLEAYKGTANALAAAIDAKDPYTRGHSQRVMEYALLAATSLNLPAEELKAIEFGGLLHDVGKIGIDTKTLRKAGSLTNLEWLHMRQHPSIGAYIIGVSPYMQKVRELVLHHHERYDGKGYPEGLKGTEIPIGARLIAIADAFDTMTTNRSYRNSMSVDKSLGELNKLANTQFCPVAIKAFTSSFLSHREMLAYKI